MGSCNRYSCKKCYFSIEPMFGVGMLFPMVYAETLERARKGEMGEKLQTFLTEHPDGAIDCEVGAIRCKKCGSLSSAPNLSMYVPKPGYDPSSKDRGDWSVGMSFGGTDYVDPHDLDLHYTLFARYPHRCESCGSAATPLNESRMNKGVADGKITCPGCGGQLTVEKNTIDWD